MAISDTVTMRLEARRLRGLTFLLGNKRAFSLCLPASPGHSDLSMHPHKWFGAHLYGRKLLEGQAVWAIGERPRFLGRRTQTSFSMGMTYALREHEVDGITVGEEYFVPDGLRGLACTLTGDIELVVEPQL